MLLRLLVICLLSVAPAAAQSGPAQGPADPFALPKASLPFKSLQVVYRLAGAMSGKETLYLLPGKSALYREAVVMYLDRQSRVQQLIIRTQKKVLEIDLFARLGRSYTSLNAHLSKLYAGLSPADQALVQGNALKLGGLLYLPGQGPVQSRQGTVRERPVAIASRAGYTLYTWNQAGVVLHEEGIYFGFRRLREVLSLQVDPKIPPERLEPPKGVKIKEDRKADKEQARRAARLMAWLKRPYALAVGPEPTKGPVPAPESKAISAAPAGGKATAAAKGKGPAKMSKEELLKLIKR